MAIHTGPAEMRYGKLVGCGVGGCLELVRLAPGGSILVSDSARSLMSDSVAGIPMAEFGLVRFTGAPLPERIWDISVHSWDLLAPKSPVTNSSLWSVSNPDTSAAQCNGDRTGDQATTSADANGNRPTQDSRWHSHWWWGMW